MPVEAFKAVLRQRSIREAQTIRGVNDTESQMASIDSASSHEF
jgi:hypothetical protein